MISHFYLDDSKFPENWFTFPKLYSYFVNFVPDNGTVVEVGSFKGQSTVYMAVEIANSHKNINFYAIDTWGGSIEHSLSNSPHYIADLDGLYDQYVSNIEPVKQYIKSMKLDSKIAAKNFQNQSIDIVFLDADHSYDAVKTDIETWLPKIKSKGIIAGHDYSPNWPGVIRAVDERFGHENISTQEYCWIYQTC